MTCNYKFKINLDLPDKKKMLKQLLGLLVLVSLVNTMPTSWDYLNDTRIEHGEGEGEQRLYHEGEGRKYGEGEGRKYGEGEGRQYGEGEGRQYGEGEGRQYGKGEGRRHY